LNITEIQLNFDGGSDEGNLSVYVSLAEDGEIDWKTRKALPTEEQRLLDKFEGEVEEWAWQVYDYSGAGDGTDYGDDIAYDIKNNKVKFNEWAMIREDQPTETEELQLADE